MKKTTVLLMVVLLSIVFVIPVFADETDDTGILFRDIPWFSREESVKKEIETSIEDIRPARYRAVEEMAHIDSWKHDYSSLYSDIGVKEGGVILNYNNVNVAGYDSTLELSFLYPVSDGKVLYDTNEALFYKAEYTLAEMVDVEGAYDDLCAKLSSLYGEGTDTSYFNSLENIYSPQRIEWYGDDGSLVSASLFYNGYLEKYDECKITYAAPYTDEYLLGLEDQILQEGADAEARVREGNSTNVDGL